MKILHILNNDDKYGSAQCFIELLEREKNIKGIIPIVVTPNQNGINEKCDFLGIKNYVVGYKQVQIPKHNILPIYVIKFIYHMIQYYVKNIKAEKNIVDIVNKEKINVIHTNSCVIDIGAKVAKKVNIKNIWHLRELGRNDFKFYSVNPFIIKRMNSKQNQFIAISKIVKKTWINRGVDEKKISMIYDGVDASRFIEKNNKEKNNKEKLKIVMCGSYCEAKNQKLLIEAINLLSSDEKEKVIVDFYGKQEGSYYENLKIMIEKCNLTKSMRFRGYADDIPKILSQYDVGVLCSRAEAFGRVTVEYMMASLCTVVPKSGANIELISNDYGILYKPGDKEELKNVLKKIINHEVRYKSMGENAKKMAKSKYDINKNYERIVELISQYSID